MEEIKNLLKKTEEFSTKRKFHKRKSKFHKIKTKKIKKKEMKKIQRKNRKFRELLFTSYLHSGLFGVGECEF